MSTATGLQCTFGTFLVDSGLVSPDDLEEATQSMVLFGGRLGTSLVEAGLLTVRELEEHLAAYHLLDPVPEEWVERPDPGARAALTKEMVARHSAYPLWFEKKTLHVGLMDPRDHAIIDDLAFASGCMIVPYAVPECRFVQLMERGFRVKPSLRFTNLMREAESARQLRHAAPAAPAQAPAQSDPDESDFVLSPLAAEIDLVDEATFDQLHQSAPPPAPIQAVAAEPAPTPEPPDAPQAAVAPEETPDETLDLHDDAGPSVEHAQGPAVPRPRPADLAPLEQVLQESLQREDIIQAAVRIASSYAELAALFVVRSDMATGARAWRGGDWIDIESIMIPTVTGSVLADAAGEKRIARAKPETQLDLRFARALGREGVHELVAIPVLLSGRVVNLLVVDAGAAPVSRTAMIALAELAPMIASAYERLIVSRK